VGDRDSQFVEVEVLQAQREKKVIILCFRRNVKSSDIKWDLNTMHGVQFADKTDLII